jgi:murein L,D-transpeptidase YcbB/YkuD
MLIRLLAAGLVLVLQWGDATFFAGRIAAASDRRVQDEIGAQLDEVRRSLLPVLPAPEQTDLAALYDRSQGSPLWIDISGALTDRARAALTLLAEAGAEGLDPAVYGHPVLADLIARLDGPDPEPDRAALAARAEVFLSLGVLRYLRHLHLGRVDPRALGLQISAPAEPHDFADFLRAAVDRGDLQAAAAELAPPFAQYDLLRAALARYRALAAAPPPAPPFEATVRPGDVSVHLPALRQLLVALGDLPADTPVPFSGVYDDALSAGVARFQRRHGLDTDGVIGASTAAALRVPLSWRVRQLELALERLRWLPDLSRDRLIAVNIPMFQLWAWDQVPSGDPPALAMSVIVGRTLDARTPVFAERMQYLVFRPYWNVPYSILKSEILPELQRDPAYLLREDLEIVDGAGDTAPVLAGTPDDIARLGTGGVRLRQRPGPENALGLVKFMFPNTNDVYMHDTPARVLFERSRRDFSHGCIRVQDPVALAEWAMAPDRTWTRDRILAAMNGAPNTRVDLPRPVQVIIFYTTAAALPDGAVHFAEDLYGQDGELDRAL